MFKWFRNRNTIVLYRRLYKNSMGDYTYCVKRIALDLDFKLEPVPGGVTFQWCGPIERFEVPAE